MKKHQKTKIEKILNICPLGKYKGIGIDFIHKTFNESSVIVSQVDLNTIKFESKTKVYDKNTLKLIKTFNRTSIVQQDQDGRLYYNQKAKHSNKMHTIRHLKSVSSSENSITFNGYGTSTSGNLQYYDNIETEFINVSEKKILNNTINHKVVRKLNEQLQTYYVYIKE